MIDCWAASFRLHYDLKRRRTYNTPGVDVRPSNFGSVKSIEHSKPKLAGSRDYFHQLVETLVGMGYTRDQVRNKILFAIVIYFHGHCVSNMHCLFCRTFWQRLTTSASRRRRTTSSSTSSRS